MKAVRAARYVGHKKPTDGSFAHASDMLMRLYQFLNATALAKVCPPWPRRLLVDTADMGARRVFQVVPDDVFEHVQSTRRVLAAEQRIVESVMRVIRYPFAEPHYSTLSEQVNECRVCNARPIVGARYECTSCQIQLCGTQCSWLRHWH